MRVFVVVKSYDWGSYGSGSEVHEVLVASDVAAREHCERLNAEERARGGSYGHEFSLEERQVRML